MTGATLDVQSAAALRRRRSRSANVMVRNPAMTFADFEIFEHWKMTEEPAMLIGMDVLGLLDTLIIDYRRKELQVKLRRELTQAALRVSSVTARASAWRRRFVTIRSCSSQIMSLPFVQKAPGMSACTRHTIPPQIMRNPKPAAATRCCP